MSESDHVETEVVVEVPTGYRESARLDVYLTRFILNATRTKVQRGIKEGRVTINGDPVTRVSHPVQAGDRIVCKVLRSPPIVAIPQDIPLDIVFEDEWLIIVDKPAGMVVHPAYGNRDGTLVNALLFHVGAEAVSVDDLVDEEDDDADTGLSVVNAIPAHPTDPSIRPGIVHRLDKDTSGLLVVAKDDVTHAHLARQFSDRTIEREYTGLVWGVPSERTGRIDKPVGRDRRDRNKMAVVSRGGKSAATNFEVVRSFPDSSVVKFRLESGRTHQIRVHAAHIGHPILGDSTYGGRDLKRKNLTKSRRAFYANILKRLPRQALHARSLGFIHPRTEERCQFTSEPPTDIREAIERLGRAF